jgi:hypothetical protein
MAMTQVGPGATRTVRRAPQGRAALALSALGLALCALTLAGAVRAQPTSPQAISTFRLLYPSDVQDVSLSPSGTRVAALTVSPSGSGILVMEWRNGNLTPVLANVLGGGRSFTGYQWLSDDYLLLPFHDFRQDLDQSVLVDIPHRAAHYLNSYVDVIKAPWGDAGHALISGTGRDCASSIAARCLLTLELAGGVTHEISAGMPLQPAQFLAVSPSEIYASGRDRSGKQLDFQLDTVSRAWRPVPDGTVDRQRDLHAADEKRPTPPTPEMLARAARAGIHLYTPVYAQPSGHIVALLGHAPDPAMIAVDSSLDGIEGLLKDQLGGERALLSGVNDNATRGVLSVWGPDHPRRYLFLTDSGLHEYALLGVRFDVSKLGRTHVERDWVTGVPVAVTLPPDGTPIMGAVVVPFTSYRPQGEDPLESYQGTMQALAVHGIAVVQVLANLPDSFADAAAGAMWRQALRDTLQTVLGHVSDELLKGRDACLYGLGTDGELSLALGALPHVGCVIAVDPQLEGGVNRTTEVYGDDGQTLTYAASVQELHRDVPAVFGAAQSDSLADATSWAPTLPSHVMLAFDMADSRLAAQANDSSSFRAAAKRSGKQLVFYARETTAQTPDAAMVGVIDAVVSFATQYFTASAATAH